MSLWQAALPYDCPYRNHHPKQTQLKFNALLLHIKLPLTSALDQQTVQLITLKYKSLPLTLLAHCLQSA